MQTTDNKIIVRINRQEKDFDRGFQSAKDFTTNYSSRNPVVCEVIQGNALVKRGLKIIAHYNFFDQDSPFQIVGDTYAIKTDENIFARLDDNGDAHSMFGNLICERIPMEYTLHMPPELQKMYPDRVRVSSDGCGYRKGQVILIEPYGDMPVIYNFNGRERIVYKVKKQYVVGFLKPEAT